MPKKLCFIGAAGSGKSTLAGKVFVELKERQFNVEYVPEMIRYDIQQNGAVTDIWEQYRTRTNQALFEDSIPSQVEYVVIDSGTLTPFFYCNLLYDQNVSRHRLVLKDMFGFLIDDLMMRRYDHIFYLPTVQTYDINKHILDDGTRTQSDQDIEILATHMELVFTKLYKLDNIHFVDCPLDQRAHHVLDIVLR